MKITRVKATLGSRRELVCVAGGCDREALVFRCGLRGEEADRLFILVSQAAVAIYIPAFNLLTVGLVAAARDQALGAMKD